MIRDLNKRKTVFTIKDGKTLNALCAAYPRRYEIIRILCETEDPLTAADIQNSLSYGLSTIYHHLKEMVASGLIIEYGTTHRDFGKDATLYSAAADYYRLDPTLINGGKVEGTLAQVAVFSGALVERHLFQAGRRGWLEDPTRAVIEHKVARISPENKERAQALITELLSLMQDEPDNPEAEEYSLNVFLLPNIDHLNRGV